MEYTHVLVDPLDSSICTIEYTPCIKVKFHKSIMAANTAVMGHREGVLHVNRPYVSKYCLPKDEYIVKIFPKCEQPLEIGGVAGTPYTSKYWLLMLTNFGRTILTEHVTYTRSHYTGDTENYYEIKGKYYIYATGTYGHRYDEKEIDQLDDLLEKPKDVNEYIYRSSKLEEENRLLQEKVKKLEMDLLALL